MEIPAQLNIASWFIDRVAREHPTRLAVAGDPEPVRYDELRTFMNRAGNALRALGCAPGERVIVALPDSAELIAAFFGIVKIGAVAVLVNPLARSSELAHYTSHCGATFAFVHASALARLVTTDITDRVRIIAVGDAASAPGSETWEHLVSGAAPELEPFPSAAQDPAFILYTSGSTGLAKAVVHTHQNMFATSRSFGEGVLRIRPEDRTLSVSKLFFAYGLGNAMYFPLSAGASTVLCPERPALETIAALLARYRPTLFFAVPGYYRTILKALRSGARFDFSSVRLALSAGEALPADLFESFREHFGLEILDGLGSTEMLQTFICNRPGQARAGTCGPAVPNYELRLTDDAGAPVPEGQIGNLWVKGASAFTEYRGNPTLTARTKVGGWVATGDKLYRDGDGYLHFCGRSDDMLKISGLWVSPIDVEAALRQHPAVERAVVLVKADSLGRKRLMAYIVMKDAWHTSLPAVRRHLREYLPEQMAAECVCLGEIPTTPNGKVDRAALLADHQSMAIE